MSDPRIFRLRVTYALSGRLAMLSHLELAHALERSVRRSGLPFAVSNGFSPHMRISFGAALPVGVGGTSEFYDLILTEYVPPDRALNALQGSCVPDLMPSACEYIEGSAKAASVAKPFSIFEAVFDRPVDGMVIPEQIVIVRKKGEKHLEVAEFLKGVHIEGNKVVFELEAKPEGSLRPDTFISECVKASLASGLFGEEPIIESITRLSQNEEFKGCF